MSHEIGDLDKTFSILGPEWHGLAETVETIDKETVRPLLFPMLAGTPSVTVETGEYDGNGNPIMQTVIVDGYKTILADLRDRGDLQEFNRTFHPIHTPRESYRIITNEEIWDCMETAISEVQGLGVKVTTAGTLQNLRKFYISVDLGDGERRTGKGDRIQSILSFRSSHDGSMNMEAGDSHTRIVCMNTFRWSRMVQGAIDVRIPHTKNASISLQNLAAYLSAVLSGREKMLETVSYLETLDAHPDEAAYASAAFLSDKDASELSTRTFNRCAEIRNLARSGKGNSGKTRWDVFNGFTEYFTHGAGAGGESASKGKRWSVANFGQAAEHKEGFANLLTDEGAYQEAIQRGEKLFLDKERMLAQ